jgi:hypothetical protein
MSGDRQQKQTHEPQRSTPKPMFPEHRLSATPPVFGFDDTAVGATSTMEIPLPRNESDAPASVHVTVEGAAFELLSTPMFQLAGAHANAADVLGSGRETPRVRFAPLIPGKHSGTLFIDVRWNDGTTQLRSIALSGRTEQPDLVPQRVAHGPTRFSALKPSDIPEQIVGSRHHFAVEAPFNRGTGVAHVAAAIEGSPDLHLHWGEPGVLRTQYPQERVPDLSVEYSPTKPGASPGAVQVIGRWEDGYVEEVHAPIRARARGLEDVPSGSAIETESGPKKPTAAGNADDHLVTSAELSGESDLMGAIELLFNNQARGVDDVQREQETFRARVKPPSIWWDLVELAVNLGIAYVTAGLGTALTSSFENMFAPSARPIIGGEWKQFELSDVEVDALKGALREGLKQAGKAASSGIVDGLKPSSIGDETEREAAADGENLASVDPTINFFSKQREALGDAVDTSKRQMTELRAQLYALKKADPSMAKVAVNALASATRAYAKTGAHSSQAAATATQWLTFKARGELGSETVHTGGKDRQVTKLDQVREARDRNRLEPPAKGEGVAGLLDINITLQSGEVRVETASLQGIAQPVADRLLKRNLAAAGLPLRFLFANGLGFITRDEVGRVRYQGYVHLDPESPPGVPGELQEHRTAQAIVDRVLSMTLSEWGIEHIQTNDANAKR